MVKRYAFTMIELIFAIVIIATSVLSLPMLIQVIGINIERNIAQEAIFASSAELTQILSYNWDTNSMDPDTYLSRVAWGADCDATTKKRPGHIDQPYHRRCTDNTLGPSVIASGNSSFLNDINTTQHPIFINSTATRTGYKKTYNSTINVAYVAFGTTTLAEENIKRVRVTVRDTLTNDIVTSLNTFSANIGEIDYYKRSY